MDNPALILDVVIRSGVADGDESATVRICRWIAESEAVHFKGKVSALGQIPNNLLEAILKEKRVFYRLISVRDRRLCSGPGRETERGAIEISVCVLVRCIGNGDIRDAVVGLGVHY